MAASSGSSPSAYSRQSRSASEPRFAVGSSLPKHRTSATCSSITASRSRRSSWTSSWQARCVAYSVRASVSERGLTRIGALLCEHLGLELASIGPAAVKAAVDERAKLRRMTHDEYAVHIEQD